jgi:hypothetical protein
VNVQVLPLMLAMVANSQRPTFAVPWVWCKKTRSPTAKPDEEETVAEVPEAVILVRTVLMVTVLPAGTTRSPSRPSPNISYDAVPWH